MNKTRANQSQCGRDANHGGHYSSGWGDHRSHSRSADGTGGYCDTKCKKGQCPAYGTTCKNCSNKNHFAHVYGQYQRHRSTSFNCNNGPSRVETTTEETIKATMVSGITMAATKATVMATSHIETFMNYRLTISYRTSSKSKAATTATMIMLMTKSLIGWCLNKATQWMQLLWFMMYPLLPSLIIVQIVLMCMSKQIQIIWWTSVKILQVLPISALIVVI